ncbi:hypothetical protein LIT38_04885 [Bacillus sp. CMF12]|uniref:hypothetical protein n=1 Tax=Bacillaceae TaxID=186817 RepID=UPI001FB510BB|nr:MULTISPECIES: hypothetical protein [Bacillaceae]MDF2038185.1 hypothetical protein [Cytobacillus oceanisediminis]UOE56311.1 hypothetical protein IRB79_06045 [Cytobacillus oceanisediminis]USK50802.1 hypothetical protein LIT38_04885 [Bacillus sp. CMF12]
MEEQIVKILHQINGKLDAQSGVQKEQGVILSALKSGQEILKAEINELRLQNAKDFGELKERIDTQEVSMELLEKETWSNKKEIHRIQKVLGMM